MHGIALSFGGELLLEGPVGVRLLVGLHFPVVALLVLLRVVQVTLPNTTGTLVFHLGKGCFC